MSKGRARKYKWLIGFAVLLAGTASVVALTAKEINDYGSVHSSQNADAAIVLGAAVWTDRPSPVFRERINHAVELYRANRVRKIIFTGGRSAGDKVSESASAKAFAIDHGVPARDVLIEERSKTTYENLQFAKAVASGNGQASFLIVSDPLHMRRAMDIAGDLDLKAQPSPTETTRYVSSESRREFLWRETNFLLRYRLYERYVASPSGR